MLRTIAVVLAAVLVTGTLGLPVEHEGGEQDLDFVLRNITALWKEVQGIRQEISYHLHDGHTEPNHDEILQDIETLHHEHHVHHLHHPHVGHNDHHDADILQHLNEVHQHQDDHTAGQPVHGHLHGHGHSHDHHHGAQGEEYHGEEEHDESHEEVDDHHHHDEHHHGSQSQHHIKHHDNEDDHDTHGLHLHEDEHTYGHEHSNEHHESEEEDEEPAQARPGLALIPGRVASDGQEDPWMHASCTLKPNVDTPEGAVRGSIVISQRKNKQGPVYFDLHIKGIDVATTGRLHGFHVHERPVAQDSCTSTGGHFNPEHVVHGSPQDDVRHVGDLGNIEVDENGEVNGYIIEDNKVAFTGPNSIIGKSIVVHTGEDDLGHGGDAGSLATGNAGGRLACCTIHITREPLGLGGSKSMVGFRFKG